MKYSVKIAMHLKILRPNTKAYYGRNTSITILFLKLTCSVVRIGIIWEFVRNAQCLASTGPTVSEFAF